MVPIITGIPVIHVLFSSDIVAGGFVTEYVLRIFVPFIKDYFPLFPSDFLVRVRLFAPS